MVHCIVTYLMYIIQSIIGKHRLIGLNLLSIDLPTHRRIASISYNSYTIIVTSHLHYAKMSCQNAFPGKYFMTLPTRLQVFYTSIEYKS